MSFCRLQGEKDNSYLVKYFAEILIEVSGNL